jgi:DNA polymerase-3 subunit epsilon
MIQWIKNWISKPKNLPEFWQDYAVKFKQDYSKRVVVLDCETTGLNPKEDRILSIGAIGLWDKTIWIEDQFSSFLKQDFKKEASIAIHGITINPSMQLKDEDKAIKELLLYLGNAKIVGHHIAFDIKMINLALERMQLPKLKNRIEDTAHLYTKYKGVEYHPPMTLDELCQSFQIILKDRHTALGDAFLTAQVYQRLV